MEKDNKQENNENTKKEEDPEELLKNHPGYGYWKREGDLKDRDQFIPKPVEGVNTIPVTIENKTTGGSAWNSAGTWEEKHYKKNQIEEYLTSNINGKEIDGITFVSAKNFTGDVRYTYNSINYKYLFELQLKTNNLHLYLYICNTKIINFNSFIFNTNKKAYTFFVRGKAKLVYDCNILFEITYKNPEDILELEINDINNHDLDADFEFSFKKMNSDSISIVKKNKKNIEDLIKKIFIEFWESQKK